jgi:hypothetical protein
MSCEEAYKKVVEALNAKTRIHDELKSLLLSFSSIPGDPGQPIIEGSDEVERVGHLMREQEPASQRLRAAWVAYGDARRRHRE